MSVILRENRFDASSSAYTPGDPPAGGTWRVGQIELGYDPSRFFNRHELYVSGLDGGFFTVDFIDRNDDQRCFQETPLEDDKTVVMGSVSPMAILVILTALGPNADPELLVVSSPQTQVSA